MTKSFLTFAFLIGGAVQAALPPFHQRMSEIDALLDDDRVESAITAPNAVSGGGSGVIDSLSAKETEKGVDFRITTGRCTLVASADYKDNPGVIGPQQFDITVAKSVACPAVRPGPRPRPRR